MKASLYFLLPIVFGIFTAGKLKALPAVFISSQQLLIIQNQLDDASMNLLLENSFLPLADNKQHSDVVKHKKLKAILLGIFLGNFGVHRIYLGTKVNVPIVYSLTLGGGFGILPLVDVIVLIASKDITPYENNDKVFMWLK